MNKRKLYSQQEKEILHFIKKVRRRLFLQNWIRTELIFIGIGFALAAGIQIVACFIPILFADEMSLVIVGIAVLVGLFLSILPVPNLDKAAGAADASGLKERISAALESVGKEDPIYLLQREDALHSIKTFDISKRLPFVFPKLPVLMTFGFLILATGAFFLPAESKEQAEILQNMRQEVKKEEQELKKVWDEWKKNEAIPKEAVEQWEKMIGEAIQELKEAESGADLDKAKERLEKKLERELAKQADDDIRDSLTEMVKNLNLTELTKFENMLKSLSNGDENLKSMVQSLLDLASKLSKDQLEKLSDMLEKMMSDGEWSMADLTDALNQLSNQDASELAKKLGENSLQVGDSGSETRNNPGTKDDKSGENSGGENGSGENDSGESGDGSSGNGNGGNSSQGNGNSGSGWNYGSKEGIEKETSKSNKKEQITLPDRQLGEDENLTGKASGDSSYTTKGESSPATKGNRVDYSSVLGQYTQKAYSKIEGNEVPSAMSDVVKSYFDELNK